MNTIGKLPVSVLIMTQNEEPNIAQAIDSVINAFDEVIVVDSFSTDATIEVLHRYPSVRVFQNAFVNWAVQRMWMIKNCNVKNEFVFFLDADEYVELPFVFELKTLLERPGQFDAVLVQPLYFFLGSPLRHAYGHPGVRRIFRKQIVNFHGQGAREYSDNSGNEVVMTQPLMHRDLKNIDSWVIKHIRNADREAEYAIEQSRRKDWENLNVGRLTIPIRIKLLIRNRIWGKLPLFVRPVLYFGFRYFFQLGFLDGRKGFAYVVMHALWYPMLIDAKLLEKRDVEKRDSGSPHSKQGARPN